MNRKSRILIVVMGMLLGSFIATHVLAAEIVKKLEMITWYDVDVEAVKTADNVIVLFNSAKTMNRLHKDTNMRHIDIAREILEERNQILPNLPYNVGLYTFAPKSAIYTTPLKSYFPMQRYNKEAFAKAIGQLPTEARGTTEIQQALLSLESTLEKLKGKTIVILFTDGVNTETAPPAQGALSPNEFARTPQELASELAQKYNICFNVISSATGELEKELLRSVASVNECSRVVSIEKLLGRPEYLAGSLFVLEEKVLKVIKIKEKVEGYNMNNVLFDFNKTEVNPRHKDELNSLGQFLQQHTKSYVILSGFTDPVGSQEYNLQLSRLRAEGVAKYLNTQFDIAEDRIVTLWYGELAPVASNDTEVGRRQNRRVAGVVAGL